MNRLLGKHKLFLVGGAVRDKLMGREAKDHDYVVVGASVDEMLALGFQQVGADFPVFLDPDTKDEYALARTERKSGRGYGGFTVDAGSHVTLEDDLRRRDLTMNSMAMDEHGTLYDPFNGQRDIESKVLRHTSEAFAEDPLRVLRLARFAARYDFDVAPETIELARLLVADGELDELTPERVWKEVMRAVMELKPHRFFEVLWDTDAMMSRFMDAVFNDLTPARARDVLRVTHGMVYSRIDGTHQVGYVPAAVPSPELIVALLATPDEATMRYFKFDNTTKKLCELKKLAEELFGVRREPAVRDELRAADMLEFMRVSGLLRLEVDSAPFAQVMLLVEALDELHDLRYRTAELLRGAYEAAVRVTAKSFPELAEGKELGLAIQKGRLAAVEGYLSWATV